MDLTEQREAEAVREKIEESLRQAQKLEAVGTLARGIAHDFNNILGALSGYAELAFESTHDNPRVHGDLRKVLQAAHLASDLVTRLLVFSRQQERSDTLIRLERPIQESLQLLRSTLSPNVEIREALDADAPEILGNETQLIQIVMNLATNALHAMKSRGGVLGIGLEHLRVDAPFVRLHPDLRPGPYALLTVSDTGHGIEPQNLERVLEPFFTTKPPSEGTGLGLSVVHGIVREHGGALEIESVPGEGTTVRVYLPAALKPGDEGIALRRAPPRGSGQRVLLVDDERALADLGQRRLEDLGYAPCVFTDSRRALEAFRQRPHDFDLVVTDQAMPHLTGIELAREIRRIRPELPVVLVSGYGETLRPESLEAAGIRQFLGKPVTEAALAEAVFTALDSRPGGASRAPSLRSPR
jgi:nitrogen-specific signal transduction histidine kinase/ActR/RegA family two-component response regulator